MAGTIYNGFTVQATVTGGSSTTATMTRAVTFYDFNLYATGAQGGGTIKLTTSGGDVTDAVACASDLALARATTFDDANIDASAASVVTFTTAGAGTAGVCNALCYVTASGANQ
jgi:hypothetical protein